MEIRIFNTLKATDIKVTAWYKSRSTSPESSLISEGTRKIGNKSWLKPTIVVPTGIYQIHIKLENTRTGLTFVHDFYNYNQDICIGWLRPGNLGGDNVNWFFKGEGDSWEYGGKAGSPVINEHRTLCGNNRSTGTPLSTRPTFAEPKPTTPTPSTTSRPTVSKSTVGRPITAKPGISRNPSGTSTAQSSDAERRRRINEYMKSLKADNKLLAFIEQGASYAKPVSINNQEYVEMSRKVDWKDSIGSTSILSNATTIYPGALLIVDDNIHTMTPTRLNIPRGKINIRIENFNHVEIGGDSVVATSSAETTMEQEVDHAIDKILSNFYKSGVKIPASFSGHYKTASSYHQAELEMKASANFCKFSLGANYNSSSKAYRNINILDFSQQYYTVKADLPEGDFSQLFGPNVTVDMIKEKVKNNALLFVNAVTYGRRAFYFSEIESNSSSVLASAKSAYGKIFSCSLSKTDKKMDVSFIADYIIEGGNTVDAEKILSDCQVKISASDITAVEMTKTLEGLHTEVKKAESAITKCLGNSFNIDRNTQGVMLSYSTQFITDNPVAAQFNTTGTYYEKSIIPQHDVEIIFRNRRDRDRYIGVTWNTYSIDNNGNEITTPHVRPKEKVSGNSTTSFYITKDDKKVKDITVTIYESNGQDEVTNGKHEIKGYPTEDKYYFVYWKNDMRAEQLDEAHYKAQKSMCEELD